MSRGLGDVYKRQALEELEKDGIETEKFLPDMKTGSNQKKCKKGFCFCPPDIFDKK